MITPGFRVVTGNDEPRRPAGGRDQWETGTWKGPAVFLVILVISIVAAIIIKGQ